MKCQCGEEINIYLDIDNGFLYCPLCGANVGRKSLTGEIKIKEKDY
jgi:uncharacterized protein (UPF0212 family)